MEDMRAPWQSSPQAAPDAPPPKRVRVTLACQRCKTKKQKCDGMHPACSKCERLGVTCTYVMRSKPMPFGKNHWLASLERRVVELEDFLTKKGMIDQVPPFSPYDFRDMRSVPVENASLPKTSPEPTQTSASWRKSPSFSQSSDSDDGDSMVRILRDLSLETNGGYIGATSQITMGRLVGSIVRGKQYTIGDESSPSQSSYYPRRNDSTELRLSDIPADVADRLLVGYMKHIATRYPVLHSAWIRDLHSRRGLITNTYERSTLHLIYATSGRFLETTGENDPSYFPECHLAEVLKDLDEMLRYHDTRSVITLLLLAVFSLRANGGPGAWAYIGLAMRIAIDLGLHRQTPAMDKLGFDTEMRKRLFWSCYTLDRQVSIPLGRPFAIADQDIDVQMPFDVDESCQDLQALERASKLDQNSRPAESTSLTAFLHVLRMRRLESKIQQTIYRVDQSTNITEAEVDFFLEQLEHWKSLIPLDAKRQVDRESIPFDGYDYYVCIFFPPRLSISILGFLMIFYYKCHRLLLYPLISKPRVNPRYLKKCAEICGGVAQAYKRLHQTLSVGYSLMSLQTVFMAGLTLIYCTWISPKEIFSSAISNDINACSIVLFVITERWPGARKYRDVFEAVKQNVIDPLADGKDHAPRQAVDFLNSIVPSALPSVQMGEGQEEFSRIMTDMLGQSIGSEMIQNCGTSAANDMEQVQYQLGDLLNASKPNPGLDPFRGFENGINAETEAVAMLNLWQSSRMNYPTEFEPFDLESFSIDMAEPFESATR